MGLFDRKTTYAFSDILKGLQHAVNSAQEMLQVQQVQNLLKFWDSTDGNPVSQRIKIGDKDIEVPYMSLVPHNHLEMDDVEIKFKARVGDIAQHSVVNRLEGCSTLSHSEMQMEMNGIKATDNDVMEITIRFKAKETPEGIARLTDEYNKQI